MAELERRRYREHRQARWPRGATDVAGVRARWPVRPVRLRSETAYPP